MYVYEKDALSYLSRLRALIHFTCMHVCIRVYMYVYEKEVLSYLSRLRALIHFTCMHVFI
jgi:hypothetical protein